MHAWGETAVKRNIERFPEDFMFRLSRPEAEALNRSQIVTGSHKHRDPRLPPYALTEHGSIMAATILNSPRAVEMSIYVVRAFVNLRELACEESRPKTLIIQFPSTELSWSTRNIFILRPISAQTSLT